MLSNIWVNIVSGNSLVPNDTVPLTDPTLILLINDAQGTNLYILMAIRIITANAFEIIFQYDNNFSRGQWVYAFGSVVILILVCLSILCINQHICWHISIQNISLHRAIMYGVTMTCVEYRLNFRTHNIHLTLQGWATGWVCVNIWGKITVLLGGPTVHICV